MIDNNTIDAFGDELAKIAGMIGNIGKGITKAISTGWNKPAGIWEKAKHIEGPLKGKKMMDSAGKQVWHERPDATWMGRGVSKEPGIHRFGDVTRALPVGDKSILTGITALGAPAALKKEDPEGIGRSRTERISGLAGGTVGSLMGMGALAHLPMKGLGITRSLVGGLAGGILGERMATSPFRRGRAELPPVTQQVQQIPSNEAV
jgi:hypothetical protein